MICRDGADPIARMHRSPQVAEGHYRCPDAFWPALDNHSGRDHPITSQHMEGVPGLEVVAWRQGHESPSLRFCD